MGYSSKLCSITCILELLGMLNYGKLFFFLPGELSPIGLAGVAKAYGMSDMKYTHKNYYTYGSYVQ